MAMHLRRLACFLLGAWIAGSLFMSLVATQNFRSVDRLLAAPSPAAAARLDKLGSDARPLLRYQVSEQNRWYFETWETIQLGLGLVLLLVLLRGAPSDRPVLLLAALMLIAVAAMHWYLTPQIVSLGRAIDFLPAGDTSPVRSRFWNFHGAYSATELIKLLLGLVLAGLLLVRRRGHALNSRSESFTAAT